MVVTAGGATSDSTVALCQKEHQVGGGHLQLCFALAITQNSRVLLTGIQTSSYGVTGRLGVSPYNKIFILSSYSLPKKNIYRHAVKNSMKDYRDV